MGAIFRNLQLKVHNYVLFFCLNLKANRAEEWFQKCQNFNNEDSENETKKIVYADLKDDDDRQT